MSKKRIINTNKVNKFAGNEAGDCPVCGAGLEYNDMEMCDDGLFYSWNCEACGAHGDEFYDVTFSTHGNVVKANGDQLLNKEGY